MRFVVSQDVASGLWNWKLLAVEGGPIAASAAGFTSLEALMENIQTTRAEAPNAMVFDLLGRLEQEV